MEQSTRTVSRTLMVLAALLLSKVAATRGGEGGAASPAPDRTARQIVDASIAASGGAALDAVGSVRRKADFHIDSPLFGVLDGTWTVAFAPGRRGFHEADLGVSRTAMIWNGETAWEEGPNGLRDLDPEELAINRAQHWELSFLHALARDGKADAVARLADEPKDGVAHYVLEHKSESGRSTKIYVDPATHLIARLATSLEITGLGRVAITDDFADHAAFEGVMLPRSTSQVIEKLWKSETKYTETQVNVELPEDLFARPAARAGR
jgi:hypothetical protein